MDSGQGRFEHLNTIDNEELRKLQNKYPDHGGLFTVGEILEIKGSKFKVKTIGKKEMHLRLLPKE